MTVRHCPIEPLARDKKLFCFGYGYTAGFLAEALRPFGWQVAGTTTDRDKRDQLRARGVDAYLFDHNHTIMDPHEAFRGVTHILLSIPPGADGDPVFEAHGQDIREIETLEWVGYLSTTAVYGNQNGNWVDENSVVEPTSRRGSLRERAEQQWLSLFRHEGVPVHLFRLSGLYGPGRSAIDSVRTGTARRIDKPGHVFNRVHVDDIVQTLVASMNKPNPGSVYNVADDMPAPSHEVIAFACNLIGREPPPLIPFDQADVAPIVRSFYKDNKRVRNDKIKRELDVNLLYPDYHSGLQACLEVEEEAEILLTEAPCADIDDDGSLHGK